MNRNLHKFLKNDNGFTLLEVLVSLVVLSLITGVVYSAANSSFSNNNKVQSNIKIHQETELILADIRRQYEEESIDKLCFNNNMIYKDESFTQKISNGNFTFTDVKIDGKLLDNNSCAEIKNADFLIAFKIEDEMEHSISISTAMSKLTAFNTTEKISIEKDSGDKPGNGGDNEENTPPVIENPNKVLDCLKDRGNSYKVEGRAGTACIQNGSDKLIFNKQLHMQGQRDVLINGDVDFNVPVKISNGSVCIKPGSNIGGKYPLDKKMFKRSTNYPDYICYPK